MAFARDRLGCLRAGADDDHPWTHPGDEDQLVRQPPQALVSFIDLGHKRQPWVDTFADDDGLIFADLGWDQEDPSDIGRLREKFATVLRVSPNSMESMAAADGFA